MRNPVIHLASFSFHGHCCRYSWLVLCWRFGCWKVCLDVWTVFQPPLKAGIDSMYKRGAFSRDWFLGRREKTAALPYAALSREINKNGGLRWPKSVMEEEVSNKPVSVTLLKWIWWTWFYGSSGLRRCLERSRPCHHMHHCRTFFPVFLTFKLLHDAVQRDSTPSFSVRHCFNYFRQTFGSFSFFLCSS